MFWMSLKGIKDMGIEFKLCYFKPSSNLNQNLVKLYEGKFVALQGNSLIQRLIIIQ